MDNFNTVDVSKTAQERDNTYEYRFVCNNCAHSNSVRITKGVRVDELGYHLKCKECKCNQ